MFIIHNIILGSNTILKNKHAKTDIEFNIIIHILNVKL